MANSGFNNPIKAKNPRPKERRIETNYIGPSYDERSSCYMNAGVDYGVGFKAPVGRKGNPNMKAPTLPQGRINTMEIYETY